ncbi:ATP-binding protein [Patescibacteria group bacterium]
MSNKSQNKRKETERLKVVAATLDKQIRQLILTEKELYDTRDKLNKEVGGLEKLQFLTRKALSAAFDLQEISDHIINYLIYERELEKGLLFLFKGGTWGIQSLKGYEEKKAEELKGLKIKTGTLLNKIIKEKKVRVFDLEFKKDQKLADRDFIKRLEINYFLATPLIGRDEKTIGILLAGYSKEKRLRILPSIDEEDIFLFSTLAGQASLFIENAEINEDIKRTQGEAEEEKNKTLAVITNFTDGLLIFDGKNNLSLINPQAENFFKIKSEQIAGKSISKLSKLPNFKPLTDLLGHEVKGIFRKELKLKENLVLEVSSIPIMAKEEKMGVSVILHDITREKIIERTKTEFVSLAAHQLRTPLSAIKWTLKMLIDGDLGKITEEQKDFIEKTYKSNERMISLINDLLNVTRIEEGRYLYKPVLTQIENVAQFVINSYKKEVKRKKIKIRFKKPKHELPKTKIDVEKMRMAIQNLVDNAVRYTKVGGTVTVCLRLLKKEKEIEFSVKDTGVGISENQQNRVFTKFFRGANAIRMETEGSGLGLFITKNIVEAHGGRIWFESKENKGTTFYFTLPTKEN